MRRLLFLQGVSSPFFRRLAEVLEARGHKVLRVNFCAGDVLYWNGRDAWNFRGRAQELPEYLAQLCRGHGVTDIVVFGDARPVHRAAIDLARRERLHVHVFEEGYVRPNWITLERGGTNGNSRLPRDPDWYLRANEGLSDAGEGRRTPASITARAAHDMAYHAANIVNPLVFPRYRTHRPYVSALEYAGWARRYAGFPWWRRQDAATIESLVEQRRPYFLFPLQLNGDAQIVHHSPFRTMHEAIECVLNSFATYAPKETLLLVKNHPLDTGLAGFGEVVRRLAREFDIPERVRYVETGHLPTLLDLALGVATVNSTVGFSAIQHGKPAKALGTAIYDIAGLTVQCTLDEFWTRHAAPDLELCRAFRNVVIHATQVNGGFYTASGIETAAIGCRHMLEPRSRLEQLLERFPARTACAHPVAS